MLTKIMIVQKDIVTAVINNDYSGLNEEDKKLAIKFCEEVGNQTINIESEELKFIRCDITKLFADCFEISLHSFNQYKPKFLSWVKSYEEEEKELRELIEGRPADLKQLKQEFLELTGKQYRAKKGA
jgi:hypothetical protein